MSEMITPAANPVESELDDLFNRMSAFVCEHGPFLLTRGMPAVEANNALLACLASLLHDIDKQKDRIATLEAALLQYIPSATQGVQDA